jgi:hypothetical protein
MYIFLISALLLLTSCSDNEPSTLDSHQSSLTVAPTSDLSAPSGVTATSSIAPNTGMYAQEILAAFNKEKAICHSVANLRRTELHQGSQQFTTPSEILNEQPFKDSMEANYITTHAKYFEIDESYERYPWTVARFKGQEQIYCALTKKRLEEIEALGESEEAWKLREFFLNMELNTLENVSGLGSGGNQVSWDLWSSELEKVSRFYATTQRSNFVTLAQKAIPILERERKNIQNDVDQLYAKGSDEYQVETIKLNKMVDDRVAHMTILFTTKK